MPDPTTQPLQPPLVCPRRRRKPEPPLPIIIDTREQRPYSFLHLRADTTRGGGLVSVEITRLPLPTGDYSIVGLDDEIAIERKSGEDLYSTIGQGRRRFERELERLGGLAAAFVVCEIDWQTMLDRPPRHSKLTIKTVMRSVIAWQLRYPNIHWWMLPGRAMAEAVTFRLLDRYWRLAQKRGKNDA